MSRSPILVSILGACLLGGCSPQPRSTSYFEAHPREAAAVVKACVAGDRRGAECDTAEAGQAKAAADARMAIYRKAFQ